MKFIKNKKAFTLIELLVVIVVVGILVLLAIPRFIGQKDKAELARIQHDVKVMEQEVGTVLINKYDDFNKWENNNKDLNQLAQEGKLFEKEGVAKEVESIDETYKIIPERYKDKINTKLKGTFYANSDGKVYYEHEKPLLGIPTGPENPAEPGEPEKEPGYSDEEIDDLVKIDFIPVATAEELNSIRSNTTRTYGKGTQWEGQYTGGLNKKYVQVANIDLSGYSEEGWNPIGTDSSSFTGLYDGGNYVITGLEVKGEDKDNQGLFGAISRATIRNVGLIDNKVTGSKWVGGLVGYASNSTIENSYATGSVKGTSRVGGLVGLANSSSTISNSYATGSVTGGDNRIGGLVGMVNNTTIENSYATGLVEGSGEEVGGLVGLANGGSTIEASYATGLVDGSNYTGGLVGWAIETSIDNSYATGSVEGRQFVGGLAGRAQSGATISNSYAKGEVTGSGYWVGGLVGSANGGSTNISNSYATGSVTGNGQVGGLVGVSEFSTIRNSYATGSVEGTTQVGGFVGYTGYGTISNSYATGSVSGTGSYVGGLVGEWAYSNTITNSYWNTDTTGQEESAGGEGKSTEDMKKADTYSAWDTDIWNIVNGDYPTLK